MKIYTVQSKDFLCFVDKEGYIIPQKYDWDKDTLEWVDDMRDVYQWMANQYSIRTGISDDRHLIWVYFRMRDVPWKYIDFDKYDIFCFEVPNKLLYKNFLWSDLIDWHWHLNHFDGWETKTDIFDFDLKKHSKNIVPQGVTTRLKKEWIKKVYQNL
ncbi:hypothetical protein EGX20_02260 [Enterococcus faecium]|uniref:hypothetical protein n=1 Tax=Enterococcus faecium TaxID=1352 RepID=UPI000F514C39|nr:hypothetical protein [Enterococcus faecium]MDQ8291660.1 hypothetical protein [Enterococcus faecium]ROY65771.1 hypothetical protein EGX20_02260 [Enterococcus faecium]